jgi:pyruvate dehydrogenase (quinone)
MTDSTLAGVVNPQRLVWELSEQLPLNAIVASDSGSSANWYARDLRFRGDVRGSLSGTLATMGPGVPYVIGAKFAHPDRPAIAIVGDGAMQMNGMAELLTIGRYWQEWSDPRLIVAVLHNNDLNQVTWEMRAMEGAPKFVESQSLPDYSYAAFATTVGLNSIEVTEPGQIADAWRKALAADRPTVLDVHTDPNVPPIPPHATFDQMKSAGLAMLHGDEDARQVIATGVKQKVQEFLPGRKGQ